MNYIGAFPANALRMGERMQSDSSVDASTHVGALEDLIQAHGPIVAFELLASVLDQLADGLDAEGNALNAAFLAKGAALGRRSVAELQRFACGERDEDASGGESIDDDEQADDDDEQADDDAPCALASDRGEEVSAQDASADAPDTDPREDATMDKKGLVPNLDDLSFFRLRAKHEDGTVGPYLVFVDAEGVYEKDIPLRLCTVKWIRDSFGPNLYALEFWYDSPDGKRLRARDEKQLGEAPTQRKRSEASAPKLAQAFAAATNNVVAAATAPASQAPPSSAAPSFVGALPNMIVPALTSLVPLIEMWDQRAVRNRQADQDREDRRRQDDREREDRMFERITQLTKSQTRADDDARSLADKISERMDQKLNGVQERLEERIGEIDAAVSETSQALAPAQSAESTLQILGKLQEMLTPFVGFAATYLQSKSTPSTPQAPPGASH